MSEKKPLDPFTVPNGITFTRLAISRKMTKRLGNDPAGTWKSTAAYAGSDVFDGLAAKGGEWLAERFKFLSFLPRIGFRKSELGRKLDPFTDKIVIGQMFKEGLDRDIIPKKLGYLALGQKAAVSMLTLYSMNRGAEPEVSDLGRHSELIANVGAGLLFAAEGIEDPQTKSLARGAFATVTLTGIGGAIIADIGYARATQEQLAQQPADV
jgi:hypothetical protein